MSVAEELKIDVMAKTRVFTLVDSLLENGTAEIRDSNKDVLVTIPIFPKGEIEIYIPIKTMQELCKDNEVDYSSLFK